VGKAAAPDWLAVNPMLELFHAQRGPARRAFARFVADGVNADNPNEDSPKAGFLGTESFIETLPDKYDPTSVSSEIPKRIRPAHSLEGPNLDIYGRLLRVKAGFEPSCRIRAERT
jgi:hypothetical protein